MSCSRSFFITGTMVVYLALGMVDDEIKHVKQNLITTVASWRERDDQS